MTAAGRAVATAIAAAAVAFLVVGPAGASDPAARYGLVAAAVIGLVLFFRPRNLPLLLLIVPLGPVLDSFLLDHGHEMYATEAVLLAALVRWGIGLWRRPPEAALDPWRRAAPVRLLGAYAVAGILALGLGHPGLALAPEGLRGLRELFLAAAGSAIAFDLVRDEGTGLRALRSWTWATVAGLAVLAVGGIVEFALALDAAGRIEPGSFYRGSVALAVHIAFFSPLALAIWISRGGRALRTAAALAWIAAMICLPLTASRGAAASVALTSAAVAIAVLRRRGGVRNRRLWLLLAVPAAGLAVLLVRPELAGSSFAYKLRATLAGDLFSTRVDSWRDALAAIRAHPLAGERPSAWAPSIPLELARRHGIPAALLALAGIVAAALRAARAARTGSVRGDGGDAPDGTWAIGTGLAAGLVGFLLAGLAETGLGARVTPLLAAAVGVAAALPSVSRVR